MFLKFKQGDRSLKKYSSVKELILSKSIQKSNYNPEIIKKFQDGDTTPEVLDYIKNLKPWPHVEISIDEMEVMNKQFNKQLFKGQNVPCIVDKETSFMIVKKS